ncbi:MAG: formylglycine-generating enzyme family protein [Verrucomicrobiales bacterium]
MKKSDWAETGSLRQSLRRAPYDDLSRIASGRPPQSGRKPLGSSSKARFSTGCYPFGERLAPEQARFGADPGDAEGTVPVDSGAANDFGLHQMHGNVSEWCEDICGRRIIRCLDALPAAAAINLLLGASRRRRSDQAQRPCGP